MPKLPIRETNARPFTVLLWNREGDDHAQPAYVLARVTEMTLERAVLVAQEHACELEPDRGLELDSDDFVPILAVAGHHDNLLEVMASRA